MLVGTPLSGMLTARDAPSIGLSESGESWFEPRRGNQSSASAGGLVRRAYKRSRYRHPELRGIHLQTFLFRRYAILGIAPLHYYG